MFKIDEKLDLAYTKLSLALYTKLEQIILPTLSYMIKIIQFIIKQITDLKKYYNFYLAETNK